MKKYIFILLLFSACRSKVPKEIHFDLGDYQFNSAIEQLLNQTNDGGLAATRYSFVSENKKLIAALSTNADTIAPISQKSWESIQNQYSFHDAKEYIIKEAGKYDFLLINEAHFIPQHRNFVRQLIPELSQLGYSNLALEGIGMMSAGGQYDQEIELRGYPTTRTGFYIKEPEFGNLIREAVNHGFTIIGYDEGSGEEREILGAKNILNAIQNSKGKTIVLCGWDHIKEVETGTYWEYALAGRIRQYTNKDVLTVNQTVYYEREERIFEDSVYQWVEVNDPKVLLDSNGASFDVQKNKEWYDIFIFHPRTKYQNGIPDWILKTNEIINFKLTDTELDCPCKIFVFDRRDDINKAVPIYIMEVEYMPKKVHVPTLGAHNIKVVISNKNKSFLIE
jgi:hypothetical protein